jgi:hypothetical protein
MIQQLIESIRPMLNVAIWPLAFAIITVLAAYVLRGKSIAKGAVKFRIWYTARGSNILVNGPATLNDIRGMIKQEKKEGITLNDVECLGDRNEIPSFGFELSISALATDVALIPVAVQKNVPALATLLGITLTLNLAAFMLVLALKSMKLTGKITWGGNIIGFVSMVSPLALVGELIIL